MDRGTMLAGDYGTIYLRADGGWYYVLDNTNPATDALNAGIIVTDRFLVRIQDIAEPTLFSDAIAVNIAITGTNDAPVIDTNPNTSVLAATINAVGTTNNVIVVNDPDMGDNITWTWDRKGSDIGTFDIVPGGAGGNGTWSFTLTHEEFLSLPDAPITVEFDITAHDADVNSEVQTLTLMLDGVNEAPVITSASTTVTEPVTTGTFVGEDPDIDDSIARWSIDTLPADFASQYGLFEITNIDPVTGRPLLGAWTFTLSDSREDALEALGATGAPPPVTIRITAEDSDGRTTTADFEIAFESRNDAPVLTLATPTPPLRLTEDTSSNIIEGTLLNDDPDAGQAGFTFSGNTLQGRHVPADGTTNFVDGSDTANRDATAPASAPANEAGRGTRIMGTYGTLYLRNDGKWEYELDNSRADTQGILGGVTAREVFELQVVNVDGDSTLTSDPLMLEIEIAGENDELMLDLSSFVTRNVNILPVGGALRGTFRANDADIGDPQIWSVVTRAPNEGTYGVFDLEPDGDWTFTFTEDGIRAYAALADGQIARLNARIEVQDRETATDGSSAQRPFVIELRGRAGLLPVIETGSGTDFGRGDLIIDGPDQVLTGQFSAHSLPPAQRQPGVREFFTWSVSSSSDALASELSGRTYPDYENPARGQSSFRFTGGGDNSKNGEWRFELNDLGDVFYDGLFEDEEAVFYLDIIARTGSGETSVAETLQITLRGRNEAPVIDQDRLIATVTRGDVVERDGETFIEINGLFRETDIDVFTDNRGNIIQDSVTWSLPNGDDIFVGGEARISAFRESGTAVGDPPGAAELAQLVTVNNTGAWILTLTDAGVERLNSLSGGESVEISFDVGVNDGRTNGLGGDTFTVTLLGTHDNPTAIPVSVDSTDRDIERGTADNTASGQLEFNSRIDPHSSFAADNLAPAVKHRGETGFTIATAATDGDNGNKGVGVTGIYGTLFLRSDGSWTYELDETDPDTIMLTSADTADDVMEEFAFGYAIDGVANTIQTLSARFRIQGQDEAIIQESESNTDAYYHIPATGRIEGMRIDNSQDLVNYRVALTEADAIAATQGTMSVIDLGDAADSRSDIGRFTIDGTTGAWTYSIIDHDYLDSLFTGAGRFDSGEMVSRTVWIAADIPSDDSEATPISLTLELTIDLFGMTSVNVSNGGFYTGTAADEIIIGSEGSERIHGGNGNNGIFARAGDDMITLGFEEDLVYYRFQSVNTQGDQNVWVSRDGNDTINNFRISEDTFVLVDLDDSNNDASRMDILESARINSGSLPFILHAMVDTTEDPSDGGVFIDTLTGFQLRFNGDSAGQMVTINYHASSYVVITEANRGDYGIDALSSTEEASTQHQITQTTTYENYFGDSDDHFQVLGELPEILTELI